MLKLIKAILNRNEHEAYTHLANMSWDKTSHLKSSGLNYLGHAIQSIICGFYFLAMVIHCIIWHPLIPNIFPHFSTNMIKKFDSRYAAINIWLKQFKFLLRKI